MIPRYECPEISAIWADQEKFQQYLKVELTLLEVLEKHGRIPKGTAQTLSEKASISTKRIDEIEAKTRHDVIAFCTSITEHHDPKIGKFFHFGVTSSDVIDTATNLQVKKSLELILPKLKETCEVLYKKAQETKDIICMGRSHGMFAEPMSFGQKFLGSYCEFARRYKELKEFTENEITGQISGAVGNYTILTPEIEKEVMDKLDLRVEDVSTQVIPRDRLAKLVSIGSLIASAIERLAIEIRHLHHSDIGELYEGFAKGQKGSSTMPHKKNPISGENLSGLSRFLRSHLTMAHENTLLWHERDISHSSAERMYLPDHFGILFYSLKRLNSTIENLVINKEHIEKKVEDNFIYLSSYFLHFMIENYDQSREDLYEIVQKSAFESTNREQFIENIRKFAQEKGLAVDKLPKASEIDLKKLYMSHVDGVFKRVEKV